MNMKEPINRQEKEKKEEIKMIKITDIKITKIENVNPRLKGIANIVIDDTFAIHNIRIIEGDNNLFLAMPSRKTVTGEYTDICHPINHETRKYIEEMILSAYKIS